MGYYNISKIRRIESCNPHIHQKGLIHPHRIMPFHDFLYCADGDWEIYINKKPYKIEKDDVIILHAGIEHFGKIPCQPNTKVYYIHVFAEGGDDFDDTKKETAPGNIKIDTVVHCQGNPEVKKLFREIIPTYWHEAVNRHEKSSLLCTMLLLRLSEVSDNSVSDSEVIAAKCQKIVSKNLDKFLTAADIAKNLFVSERTVRNAFKRKFDMTPIQYQREMKLNRAIALMREYPQLSSKEIAANLGFTYESHFYKLFKQKYGISPGDYRDKVNNSDELTDFEFVKLNSENITYPYLTKDGDGHEVEIFQIEDDE